MAENRLLKMKIGILSIVTFEPIPFDYSLYLRGYFINNFEVNQSFHNHDDDEKSVYDYPLIQYKILENNAVVLGIGEEAIHNLEEIGQKLEVLNLNKKKFRIKEIAFMVNEDVFGESDTEQNYLLATPTLLLNQKNYTRYRDMNKTDQHNFLAQSISNQMLATAKRLDYTVTNRITCQHSLETTPIHYKNKKMLGFIGYFQTNFYLPHLLGIGKGVSRGYGCCFALE